MLFGWNRIARPAPAGGLGATSGDDSDSPGGRSISATLIPFERHAAGSRPAPRSRLLGARPPARRGGRPRRRPALHGGGQEDPFGHDPRRPDPASGALLRLPSGH